MAFPWQFACGHENGPLGCMPWGIVHNKVKICYEHAASRSQNRNADAQAPGLVMAAPHPPHQKGTPGLQMTKVTHPVPAV